MTRGARARCRKLLPLSLRPDLLAGLMPMWLHLTHVAHGLADGANARKQLKQLQVWVAQLK